MVGKDVTVHFEGSFVPRAIEGKVVRASVSSIANGRLRYHMGIAFSTVIDLDEFPNQEPLGEPQRSAATPVIARNRW